MYLRNEGPCSNMSRSTSYIFINFFFHNPFVTVDSLMQTGSCVITYNRAPLTTLLHDPVPSSRPAAVVASSSPSSCRVSVSVVVVVSVSRLWLSRRCRCRGCRVGVALVVVTSVSRSSSLRRCRRRRVGRTLSNSSGSGLEVAG
jgi:hypothetical protein